MRCVIKDLRYIAWIITARPAPRRRHRVRKGNGLVMNRRKTRALAVHKTVSFESRPRKHTTVRSPTVEWRDLRNGARTRLSTLTRVPHSKDPRYLSLSAVCGRYRESCELIFSIWRLGVNLSLTNGACNRKNGVLTFSSAASRAPRLL